MTTTTNPSFYIRAGKTVGSASTGYFNLEGVPCVILVSADASFAVHKVNKTKLGYSVKPIATGLFVKNTAASEKAPDLNGIITTVKGSKFKLSAWLHDDGVDQYYVVRYDVLAKAGTLFRIQ